MTRDDYTLGSKPSPGADRSKPWIYRWRLKATYPAFGLLFVLVRGELNPWGLLPLACGVALRLWASGHLDKNAPALTTSGPYRWVRNPLYLGTLLLSLGLCLKIGRAHV